MPSLNVCHLIGNLTRDPELRVTPNGSAICQFGLAINRTFKDGAGQQREEVTFLDVEAWGKQAEVIAKYCTKGKALYVQGRLKLNPHFSHMSTPQTPRNQKIPSTSGAKTPADPVPGKTPPCPVPDALAKGEGSPPHPSLPAATHRLLNAIKARQELHAGEGGYSFVRVDAAERELSEARRVVEEILALPPVTGKEAPCPAPVAPAKEETQGDVWCRVILARVNTLNEDGSEKTLDQLLDELPKGHLARDQMAGLLEMAKRATPSPAKEETHSETWCRKILAREASQRYAACESLIREVEGFRNYRDDNGRRLKDAPPWCEFYSAVKAFGRTPMQTPASVLKAGTLQQADAWQAVHDAVIKHLAREYAATESDSLNGMQHTVAAITTAAAELRKLQGFYDRIVARFGTDDIFGHVRRLEGEVEIARNDVRLSEGAYAMANANIASLKGQLKEADAKRESLAKSLLDTVTKGCEHAAKLNAELAVERGKVAFLESDLRLERAKVSAMIDHPPAPAKWEPKVGDEVIHRPSGTFGRIFRKMPGWDGLWLVDWGHSRTQVWIKDLLPMPKPAAPEPVGGTIPTGGG